ncbi:MAG TPA: hypothetical protein VFG62_24330, partial [Rhodopila sp.]|nr:hypothetical protein [Rhodopila sp.]
MPEAPPVMRIFRPVKRAIVGFLHWCRYVGCATSYVRGSDLNALNACVAFPHVGGDAVLGENTGTIGDSHAKDGGSP